MREEGRQKRECCVVNVRVTWAGRGRGHRWETRVRVVLCVLTPLSCTPVKMGISSSVCLFAAAHVSTLFLTTVVSMTLHHVNNVTRCITYPVGRVLEEKDEA